MNLQRRALPLVIAVSLGMFGAGAAWAQSTTDTAGTSTRSAASTAAKKKADKAAVTLATVNVTGNRGSLESAAMRKQLAEQIVDSIVASDIGKLPDTNLADALQRVTGVQVTQDAGEGSRVAIRGLTEIETQLNGNTIFTAAGGRSLNFEDIPAELMADVDVYKTPTADQVEGGIGGIVDLRTHRPFDFDGLRVAASAAADHADLADRTKPKLSALVSNTWNTDLGKIGALLALSYQVRPYRENYTEMSQPLSRSDLVAGQTINAPYGEYYAYNYGTRSRVGVNGSLQWQPSKNLEFYLDSYLADFKSHSNTEAMYVNTSYGSGSNITLYPGTSDFRSGTFNGVGVEPESFTQDLYDKTYQFSGGGSWHNDSGLKLSSNLSYTNSVHDQHFNELSLWGNAPSFSVDTTTTVPTINYNGFDIRNASNFNFNTVNFYRAHNTGEEKTFRFDGQYDTENSFFQSFKAGVRYSDRTATNASINDVRWSPDSGTNYFGQSASTLPNLLTTTSFSDLGTWLVPNPGAVRDAASIFKLFNIGSLPSYDPLSIYNLSEKTSGGYASMSFGTQGAVPISGNIGVRAVQTKESVIGSQSLDGVVTPLNKHSDYWNVLPSLNVQFDLTDTLQGRIGAAKTVTRPDFSQLSPSLTLTTYFHTGSAGNPNLKPMKADNFDASLGWYFNKGGYVFGDVFYKKVDGFIAYTTDLETYYGQQYQISRPTNSDRGMIRGVELAYQQFFDFLPDPFKGFGVQANYTYVDSSATGIIPGQTTPLENLSKNSSNVVLIYENHGLSARLAYNWRSRFLSSTYYTNTSLEPIYMKSYGILDASLAYDVTRNVTLTLDMVNLLQRHLTSYYLRPTIPDESYLEDRRITAGVRVKF
jgi:TonB-dependent receptor